MKKSDPAKAAQLERLGMGFGGFGGGGKSHSLVSDVVEIVQVLSLNKPLSGVIISILSTV